MGILTQAGVDKKRLQDLRHKKVLPASELEQRLLNLANLLRHANTLKNHLHQQEKVVKIYQQLLGGQDKLSIKRQLFKELIEWLFADERTHPLVRVGVAYKYLIEEKVFPLDSELMARLFLLLLLRHFGYQVAKMWVLEDYDLLNLSRFRGRLERPCLDDYAPWLDYFIKGVRYSLQVSYDSAYAWQEIVLASHNLTAAEKKTYQQLRDYAGAKNSVEKAGFGEKMAVSVCKTKYPQGGEKNLVKAAVGREIPSGGLPCDIGCIIQNVGTVKAISEAFREGK